MKPTRHHLIFLAISLLFIPGNTIAQVAVNTDNTLPDSSSMLDVKSSTKGFLAPRMTAAERDAIVRPANGLLIFCTDNNQYYANRGTCDSKNWVMLSTQWCCNGSNIHYPTGNVGIGITNPGYLLHVVGGDVKIGNSSGDARKLYFGDGTGVFIGEDAVDNRLDLTGTSLAISIGGTTGSSGNVLTSNGTTCSWSSPQVTGNGTTDYVARWASASLLGTGTLRDNGLTVGVGTGSDANIRLKSDGSGTLTAVYGRYDANKYGLLGHYNYGVYGQYDDNHYGYLGSNNYGVYGWVNGNSSGYAGVYGDSYVASAGSPAVYGFSSTNTSGTAYTRDNSVNGVVGFNNWGNAYHFGVFGSRYDDTGGPSAGVIGTVSYSDGAKPWGALGYQDASSNEFAGYFSGNIKITGGIHDGTNYGVSGSVLMSDGVDDVYWSATAGLSGNGTSNYLPKYTGATTFANSQLYDNSTSVGIGITASLLGKLHVYSNSASTSVYGQYNANLLGYLGSSAYGAYGQSSSTLYGYLGSSSYGAYGQYNANTKGYIGSSSYGAYGQYDANKIGYLGSSTYGAYGQYNSTLFGYLGSAVYGVYGQYSSSVYGTLGSYGAGVYGQYNANITGGLGTSGSGAYGQYNANIIGYLGTGSYGAYGQINSSILGYLGSVNYGAYGQYNTNILGYFGSSGYGAYGQYNTTIKGYLGSSSYGVYGQNGTIYVYVGGSSYGVLGQQNANIYGYLGGGSYGAYGQYSSDICGYLGGSSYGVYGKHVSNGGAAAYFEHTSSPASYTSQWAVDSKMINSQTNDGSSYGYNASGYNSGSVRGYNYWGAQYTFSVAGWNYNDDNRCSGVLGAYVDGSYWGALGYKTSGGSTYGGYFTTSTTGSGKKAGTGIAEGTGIGAWGGLMGADIHGGVYGLFVEGENYGIYSKGTIYSDKPSVQLQDVGESERAVLFTNTSAEVTVMTSGQGNLVSGQSSIVFDQNFRKVISGQAPVIITVTPMGPSNGVYISSSDNNGFTITENNNGNSHVAFNYIAVARRAGYENPQIPEEIAATEFESLIAQGLHDDSDARTDGKGLYYQDGKLHSGQSPASLMKSRKK
jgi:hypothetical protein